MTDQQSTHASLSPAVGTYYSKKALKDFEPNTVWYASAPMREMVPKGGGNIIQFTRYRKIDALYADNSDQFTATQLYESAQTINATLHERDGYVQISRFADLTIRNRGLDQIANKMTKTAAKTVDKLIRNDIGMIVADKATYSANMFDNMGIDGGTLNSSGITARIWTRRSDGFPLYHNKTRLSQSSTVVSIAASAMTVRTMQHGVSVLQSKDVDTLPSGNYKMICRPEIGYSLTSNPGWKGWISPTAQDGARRRPTELGIVAGVEVEYSTLGFRFPVSGDTLSTSSGNVYGSLLFGSEAYGSNQIGGEGGSNGYEFTMKQSGAQTTGDPTNMKKTVGFSVTGVGRVINKSAGLWLITTAL